MKSKYGTVRGTTYGSSRTNLPSSASKTRGGIGNAADTAKPHKAPVQVGIGMLNNTGKLSIRILPALHMYVVKLQKDICYKTFGV